MPDCKQEFVFIVDVDGGTWGVMGAYEPEAKYGGLFEQDFTEILAADSRQVLKDEIRGRTATHCGPVSTTALARENISRRQLVRSAN